MALSDDQRRFLDAFAECGSVTSAAKKASAGSDRTPEALRVAHYRRWLRESEEYAKEFASRKPEACGTLEDAAWDRAVNGWEDPVYQGGVEVGKVWRYDSGLLKFLLRGNMPDKYGDKVVQQHEGGVEVVVTYERTPTNRD